MKRIKRLLTCISVICALSLGLQLNVFAAAMQNDWSQNPTVGWSGVTQGGLVFAVQDMCGAAGMSTKVPSFTVFDGLYGNGTHAAIAQYQKDYSLSADGTVGPNTWRMFANHTYYIGNSGSIQIYESQYSSGFSYTHFEVDSYNGWCVRSGATGQFIKCNDVRYQYRTFIPL